MVSYDILIFCRFASLCGTQPVLAHPLQSEPGNLSLLAKRPIGNPA
jgi:hypothetical protein